MSKVIAVMDRPKDCQKCWFSMCHYSLPLLTRRKGYSCRLKEPQDRVVEDFDYDEVVHLSNCPLKEIPERAYHENFCDGGRYDKGYNDCLDTILGGEENG